MESAFEYSFPVISGVQAGRQFYVSMCPLRLLPKLILFDEEELVPELRAQRTLNKGRIPEMKSYVLDNPQDYVFSAITVSIDAAVKFAPTGGDIKDRRIGILHIPMDAKFVINDGQHRRAAIDAALRENPDLGDETIAVVFFVDEGLERCQQMFADLNRYAIRPSRSLGVLYDHRDQLSAISRNVVFQSEFFQGLVETEKSTLSARSKRLFTLSAIHTATKSLLDAFDELDFESGSAKAQEFWTQVVRCFPEWKNVKGGQILAGDVRKDYIHSHAISLHALAIAGGQLMREYPSAWKRRLQSLRKLDWRRSNTSLWEGRAMNGGAVSKAGNNVRLTANVLKKHLSLELSPDERRIEDAFVRGSNGKS